MGVLKLITPLFYKYKYYLLLYCLCICLSYPLKAIIIPKLFSQFFNDLKGTLNNSLFVSFIKKIGIYMFIISIAHTIISKLDIFLIPLINENISNNFFTKILYYYENNYADLELGKMLIRINNLPSIIREVTSDLFIWVLPKFITIIIINIYFFKQNKKLGILSTILILLIIYFNINNYTNCINLSTSKYNLYENKSELLQDKISNLYSIYASGNINYEINDFKTHNKIYKQKHIDCMKCSYAIKNKNEIIITFIFVILAIFITYLVKNNHISQNTLITLFIVLIFYIPCLNNIAHYLPDYTNQLGIINSITDYIDTIFVDNHIKPDIVITQGNITIHNLTFNYESMPNIFNNFNLSINSNDKIGIVGPSGNGKSTLIKLIMGYYYVEPNTIFIDNQDINNYNLSSLRRQITYINQNTKLFNNTIFYNIKYGNNVSEEEIMNIYNMYKLDRIFNNLEDKFNTVVGVNGDSLSGGQKQIILLLRNYFKTNKIVILDEPTSALDQESINIVLQIIKKISLNSTLILITHDMKNLELVDKKIVLIQGKIQ